jgi:type IV pilus assembly protein PilQ
MPAWRFAVAAAAPVLVGIGLSLGTYPAAAQQPGCYDRLPTEPVTLSLRDANVQTTLRLLAQQYRINMIVTDDVTSRVTLDFFQVPVRDVVQSILESTLLRCVEQAGVLRVSTQARLKTEEAERAKLREDQVRLEADTRKRLLEAQREQLEVDQLRARGPITERTIRLRYADAEEVAKTLLGILGLPPEGSIPAANLPALYQPLPPTVIPSYPTQPAPQSLPIIPPAGTSPSPLVSPLGGTGFQSDLLAQGLTVRAHKPTNSLFLRYYANDLDRIERLIRERLDIVLPQVQIAAQMVITTQQALEQLGVQWGGAVLGRPRGQSGPALIGTGLASQPTTALGLPTPPVGGTGVATGTGNNPNFTGSSLLPVDPATGIPVGGNLVNLPLALLPTLANPGFGMLFGIIAKDFNINLAIEALETQNKARRIAAPKIVTVENGKAAIARGLQVPFISQSGNFGTNVQFADALLRLEVTPTVIQEDGITRIRMKVLVQNDEPDFSQTVLGNPTIFRRNAQSEVVIREGERLVIGGVMNETRARAIRQVPVLGNMPVLGWLFKSRETNEVAEDLIVIITPSVVARTDGAVQR